MRHMIRAVSMTAVLLGAGSAFAQEVSPAPVEEDLRTEEQKAEDALHEAWDNAQIEALMASTAAAPTALVEEADEAEAEPVFGRANEYTEEQAVELLRSTDVESFSSLAAPPVQLRGCWYFVTTPPQGRYGPPRYQLTVQRMPSRHCEAQTVVLDSSYAASVTVATKESKGLAVSFASKGTPSGSGLVHVRLFALNPKDLSVSRTGFLGTYRGSTSVYGMHFEGNRLLVQTNRYTATYPRFLTSEEPPIGVIFP